MTSLARVALSPSALSGPQGLASRRGRISIPVAHRLTSLNQNALTAQVVPKEHYSSRTSVALHVTMEWIMGQQSDY